MGRPAILIVEDEPDLLQIIKIWVERQLSECEVTGQATSDVAEQMRAVGVYVVWKPSPMQRSDVRDEEGLSDITIRACLHPNDHVVGRQSP